LAGAKRASSRASPSPAGGGSRTPGARGGDVPSRQPIPHEAPTSPPAARGAASLPLAGEASSDVPSLLTTAAAETTCAKPCAATGVSRDDPDNGSKGGAEQKEGAAVERREARPPPHLPPPRERCGGGKPRPKRRRRRRRLRGAESAQRLPALRSRRFWGAIRSCLWPQSGRVNTARARTRRESAPPFRPREAGEGDRWSSRSERTVVEGAPDAQLRFRCRTILFAGRSELANMIAHHEDSCGASSPAPPPPPCFAGWSPSPAIAGADDAPASPGRMERGNPARGPYIGSS
jgi:hypothetical protein